MPIYNFDDKQKFSTIDKIPDHRSDSERLNSPLSFYNHDNPDIAYAERLAEEWINIAGAWITFYKRVRNHGARDEVWDEDADPTYDKGSKLKGFMVPAPVEAELTKYGIDTPNKTIIHFSRANVFKMFGNDMIPEGSILIVPHNTLSVVQNTDLRSGVGNRMDRFRVLKAFDTGNFKYRWLYWSCVIENITGDKSIDVAFSKEKA